jgi:hypothetical protein
VLASAREGGASDFELKWTSASARKASPLNPMAALRHENNDQWKAKRTNMKRDKSLWENIRSRTKRMLLAAALAGVVLPAHSLYAGPPDRYREPPRDSRSERPKPPVHHPGNIVRELPPGYRPVDIHGARFFERGGVYFKPAPGGYMVVDAPMQGAIVLTPTIGTIALSLPIGAVNVRIGGTVYYRAGNVFYRRAPQGYVVIERPANVVVVESPPVTPLIVEAPKPSAFGNEPLSVWVGDQEYFMLKGAFYRKTPAGLKPVQAPLGAVLAVLPLGCITLWIDNNDYAYCNSVFYRKTPVGYAVVSPPQNAYVKSLPKDSRTVFTGGRKYFYVNGSFYEPKDQGYLICAAPWVLTPSSLTGGTIFAAPPDGSLEIWVNDTEYLYLGLCSLLL